MLPLISHQIGVFCVPLRGEVEKLHRVKRSGTVLARSSWHCCLGRLAVSLPLQIESREFLQVSVSHALQLDFETLLQLADEALIAIACRCCGARRVIENMVYTEAM